MGLLAPTSYLFGFSNIWGIASLFPSLKGTAKAQQPALLSPPQASSPQSMGVFPAPAAPSSHPWPQAVAPTGQSPPPSWGTLGARQWQRGPGQAHPRLQEGYSS